MPTTADSPAIDRAARRALSDHDAAAAETVRRLLAVAVELLSTKGIELSIDDIVSGAGISRRTFYRFYRSKEELLLAVFESLSTERERRQQAVLDSDLPATDKLRGILHVRWTWPEEVTRKFALTAALLMPVWRSQGAADYNKSLDEIRDLVADALESCRAEGVLRPTALTTTELATLVSLTVAGVVSERLLALRGPGTAVPPDDAGFERLWAYLEALVVAP